MRNIGVYLVIGYVTCLIVQERVQECTRRVWARTPDARSSPTRRATGPLNSFLVACERKYKL